jgi:hypothetical protein
VDFRDLAVRYFPYWFSAWGFIITSYVLLNFGQIQGFICLLAHLAVIILFFGWRGTGTAVAGRAMTLPPRRGALVLVDVSYQNQNSTRFFAI